MKNNLSALIFSLIFAFSAAGAEEPNKPNIVDHSQLMDHGDGHLMDMDGAMIMGQNKDKLPAGCDKISEDVKIEVHAGRKYSKQFPGTIFGFDKHEWRVKPCTRLTVTFVNEDNVRHQWMMHGLPKFMYDKGMFHLEITGPAKVTGTLILPAEDKTYLVHCDEAQHMEKGMKAQLIVGKGSGTFPTIPGVTDPTIPDNYGPEGNRPTTANPSVATVKPGDQPAPSSSAVDVSAVVAPESSGFFSGSLIIGLLVGFVGAPFLFREIEERCKGMTAADVLQCTARLLKGLYDALARFVSWLIKRISGNDKLLPKK
jgi:plastocyanin